MARSARSKSDRDRAGRLRQQFALWWQARIPQVKATVGIALGVAAVVGAGIGLDRLEGRLHADRTWPATVAFEFIGAPTHIEAALQAQVADLQGSDWLDTDLCAAVHQRLADSAWIRTIRLVGKSAPGVVTADCTYRQPVALVQPPGSEYYCLIDEFGVRLPGTYRYESDWVALTGVEMAAPEPGDTWAGEDVTAGLELIRLLATAPFIEQIHAVDLRNLDGRREPLSSHVVIRTDRGSTILWGSAPGREFGENTVAEKMAILAANHKQHARIDGAHDIIDISVYPDRYIVRR